jgi:hypothetical protein
MAAPPPAEAARLAALLRQAGRLAEQLPRAEHEPARARPEAERLNQIIDAQEPLLHEGESAPLAEPVPDSIPMTGEEDPIVEVDDPEFAQVVAEFMRSERDARAIAGGTARLGLAQALLPFADTTCDPIELLTAIEAPFAGFAAALTTDPSSRHAADSLLIELVSDIATRAAASPD